MQYQFIIKESPAKTAKILFKGAWIECENSDDAWLKFHDFIECHPEYENGSLKLEKREEPKGRGGKRPNTGGKREGSGRPLGSGKWGDERTTIARIPVKAAQNIEELLESQDQLDNILRAWKAQCKNAKQDSMTGKIPRTYDKVLALIQELEEEVNKLPYII